VKHTVYYDIFIINILLIGGDKMTFGYRLRCLREEKSLSQVELAKHLSITNQSLSQYELDKRMPDANMLKNLANYFEVSIDYLLGRTNDRVEYIETEQGIPKDNIIYKTYEEMLSKLKDMLAKEGIISEADPLPKEAIDLIFKHGAPAAIDILKLKLKE
jgi:transcriptional regulator with XRE-family HTH domain